MKRLYRTIKTKPIEALFISEKDKHVVYYFRLITTVFLTDK